MAANLATAKPRGDPPNIRPQCPLSPVSAKAPLPVWNSDRTPMEMAARAATATHHRQMLRTALR